MPRASRLTPRQIECTLWVGRGLTESEIAGKLGISTETVKRHLKEARGSYGVDKSIQLLIRAMADGLVKLEDLF